MTRHCDYVLLCDRDDLPAEAEGLFEVTWDLEYEPDDGEAGFAEATPVGAIGLDRAPVRLSADQIAALTTWFDLEYDESEAFREAVEERCLEALDADLYDTAADRAYLAKMDFEP